MKQRRGCYCDFTNLGDKLTRTKTLDADLMKTPLDRCLSLPHLVLFGIGQMVGAGIYVLTGTVAKYHAGPAAPLAYLLGGMVSILSALCYAEFGARIPKAGSSFTFAYISIGEFVAFIIGWNIILEHCITTAATARAWSDSIDVLTNGALNNFSVSVFGTYKFNGQNEAFDPVSPALIIVLAILIILGAKISMTLSAVVAGANILIIAVMFGAGISQANFDNWVNKDNGGYAPFGAGGIIGGTALTIYAYSGYDAITIAAEETTNPKWSIPRANIGAMIIVMFLYVGMASVLTLMTPFNLIDAGAAFPVAFQSHNMQWAVILVSIGTLVSITGVCLGNIYSVSRTAYAMANDGVIFRFIGYVNPKTQTPVVAIVCFAILASLLAFTLTLETLSEFVSIGTLIAVTLVAASVIVLRYKSNKDLPFAKTDEAEDIDAVSKPNYGRLKPRFENVPYLKDMPAGRAVSIITGLIFIPMTSGSLFLVYFYDTIWGLFFGILSLIIVLALFFVIWMHVMNDDFDTFQMPLVPYLPVLSMQLNVMLLVSLSVSAWVRFAVWMAIGLIIYFGYGIHFSTENKRSGDESSLIDSEPPSYASTKEEKDL